MSQGNRLPHSVGMLLAQGVIEKLAPVCQRIEVAGSLRRKLETVGDVEIVCIPRVEFDLFTQPYYTDARIEDTLAQAGYLFKRSGEYMKQFDLGPVMCDLFITTPSKWGVIFALRTGSAEFSHRLVTVKSAGGYLPGYLRVAEGRVVHRNTGIPYPTEEEEDFFKLIGLDWIEPERRG